MATYMPRNTMVFKVYSGTIFTGTLMVYPNLKLHAFKTFYGSIFEGNNRDGAVSILRGYNSLSFRRML